MFIWVCCIDSLYDTTADGMAIVRAKTADEAARLLQKALIADGHETGDETHGGNNLKWLTEHMQNIGIAHVKIPAVLSYSLTP